MILTQSFTAVCPNITSSFLALAGTAPYTYSVLANGAGGTINSSSGLYTAPQTLPDAAQRYDTIRARDSAGNQVTSQILVGNPLMIFCDIIQNYMGLGLGRVMLWDQKIFMPTDSDLYIAVSVLSAKAFGNTNRYDTTTGFLSNQSVNMLNMLSVDIISRGPAARDRKEEIILALNSDYAQSQQSANGFYIGKIQSGGAFVNLSNVDGAAIPYRFNISVAIQYSYSKSMSVPYLGTFSPVSVITNP